MNIRNQYCLNEDCQHYRQVLAGNIVVHSQKQSRFRCTACRKTWVAHRNQLHYGLKTGVRKVIVAKYLLEQESMSIRGAAAFLGVSPSTVQRFKKRLAVVA